MMAADARNDPVTRRKSHYMLSQLQPGLFVSIGMASDYMQECMSLLRNFERDIDFSQVPELLSTFRTRMETLFLQAKVLEEVEGEAVIQTGAAEILDKLRSNQGEGGKRERQRERERE